MKTQTIVFDIDGVMADFIGGAMKVSKTLFNREMPAITTMNNPTWDVYPGLTPQEVTQLWAHIAKCPWFWSSLDPLASHEEFVMIRDLVLGGHRVYFATNRKTPNALGYTYWWLYDSINDGHTGLPLSVVTTHRKGEFCKVVDATYYIDDKSENVDCAIWMTDKKVKAYVIDRPYNQGAKAPHSEKAGRVATIADFIKEIV